MGSLGLKDLIEVNKVTIVRLAWRFLSEPDKLWVQVLLAKYGDLRVFDEEKSLGSVSFTWRSVVEGFQIICEGLELQVEDGCTVLFRQDL